MEVLPPVEKVQADVDGDVYLLRAGQIYVLTAAEIQKIYPAARGMSGITRKKALSNYPEINIVLKSVDGSAYFGVRNTEQTEGAMRKLHKNTYLLPVLSDPVQAAAFADENVFILHLHTV